MTEINHRRNGKKYSKYQRHNNSLYPVLKGFDYGYGYDGRHNRRMRRWIKATISRKFRRTWRDEQ